MVGGVQVEREEELGGVGGRGAGAGVQGAAGTVSSTRRSATHLLAPLSKIP